MYNLLPTFAVLFPNIDTDALPDPGLFREAINSAGEEVLEKLRKDSVQYLLQNPSNSLLFIFNLAKAR